jgi:hypothetical protein
VVARRLGALNAGRVFGLYPRRGPWRGRRHRRSRPGGVVDERFYHCLCETSVCGGYRFRGMARTTIVRGRVMMDEFETVGAPGWGGYVPRGGATPRRS